MKTLRAKLIKTKKELANTKSTGHAALRAAEDAKLFAEREMQSLRQRLSVLQHCVRADSTASSDARSHGECTAGRSVVGSLDDIMRTWAGATGVELLPAAAIGPSEGGEGADSTDNLLRALAEVSTQNRCEICNAH